MNANNRNGTLPELRDIGGANTAGNAGATFANLAAVFIDAARRDRAARENVVVDCAGGVWGANMPEGENEKTAVNGRE